MLDNIYVRGEKKYSLSEKQQIESGDSGLSQRQYFFFKETQEYLETIEISHPPLFTSVELETFNCCNGVCSFCPVNRYADKRTHIKMSKSLFLKILKELREIGYSNRLALFSNNEPFLDSRIVDWVHIARQYLPNAYIYLYSNGTLLTEDKYKKIMKYLNYLVIDNYCEDYKTLANIEPIIELCKANEKYDKRTLISIRKSDEILYTRGGNAPNRKEKIIPLKMSCILPFKQLIIRPDGKLSQCNNDALGEVTLGDVCKSSLIEAWYSKEYMHFREKISKGRAQCILCKNCDSLFHPCSY